jgi:hypothetical protein
MLVAWAGDTDGNLSPLCRSTAFKLTFEESVNKAILLDCVGVQEPLLQTKYLYKNIRKTSKICPNIGNLNTFKPTLVQ